MKLTKYTPKTFCFKAMCDALQWIPRVAFLLILIYLLYTSLKLRIYEVVNSKKSLDLYAELSASNANHLYQRSLRFWYKKEIQLEQLLF